MRFKLCLTLFFVGLISFVVLSEAQARFFRRGSCGVRVSAPVIVHEPVVPIVEVPIAYPILVPAFQFQYQQPCYAPPPAAYSGYNFGTANYTGEYPMYNQGIPPVSYNQMNSLDFQKDKIRELAKALLEELNRQTDQADNNNGPPVNPFGGQSNNVSPTKFNPNLANLAISAMARTCSNCHTGVGSKGDTVIFLQPGLINNNAPWGTIKKQVERGKMPPAQSHYRLTREEFTAILSWLSTFNAN